MAPDLPDNQVDVFIPDLYMCADGPSIEIEEANLAQIILVDEHIVFTQVYSDELTNGK